MRHWITYKSYQTSTIWASWVQIKGIRIGGVSTIVTIDWPSDVCYYGNADELNGSEPRFGEQIRYSLLGSPPLFGVLKRLQPKYWFSAHFHCKFAAIIPDYNADVAVAATEASTVTHETKFLGLDECLPNKQFLQIINFDEPKPECTQLLYDLEWLTISSTTKHLAHVKNRRKFICPVLMISIRQCDGITGQLMRKKIWFWTDGTMVTE